MNDKAVDLRDLSIPIVLLTCRRPPSRASARFLVRCAPLAPPELFLPIAPLRAIIRECVERARQALLGPRFWKSVTGSAEVNPRQFDGCTTLPNALRQAQTLFFTGEMRSPNGFFSVARRTEI